MNPNATTFRPPRVARDRLMKFVARQELVEAELSRTREELEEKQRYIELSNRVTSALEVLSKRLFSELLSVIEQKLTIALQEVLEQPIALKAHVDWKRNVASVDFTIERGGFEEDIMRGQGGSVANILSVGLRMFALTTLDPDKHRRFLVLDEQDCWLRPDLVPRLVKIVHAAGQELGFQVLMISHHDASSFQRYADRILRLVPGKDGVAIEPIDAQDLEN